eukprot:349329-Hanusia_phi.AAC.2
MKFIAVGLAFDKWLSRCSIPKSHIIEGVRKTVDGHRLTLHSQAATAVVSRSCWQYHESVDQATRRLKSLKPPRSMLAHSTTALLVALQVLAATPATAFMRLSVLRAGPSLPRSLCGLRRSNRLECFAANRFTLPGLAGGECSSWQRGPERSRAVLQAQPDGSDQSFDGKEDKNEKEGDEELVKIEELSGDHVVSELWEEWTEKQVKAATLLWVEQFVIGLKLCPFAAEAMKGLRVSVSSALDRDMALDKFDLELRWIVGLDKSSPACTLIVYPPTLFEPQGKSSPLCSGEGSDASRRTPEMCQGFEGFMSLATDAREMAQQFNAVTCEGGEDARVDDSASRRMGKT